MEVAEVAASACYWLRREIAQVGLEGQLTARLVNPRAQAWLAGFTGAVVAGLELDAAKGYELEARLYVSLFEGTPMGEQLGLEALQMAKHFESFPAMMPDWVAFRAKGADAGRAFVALVTGFREFGQTFR